jgi:hypothetical protein
MGGLIIAVVHTVVLVLLILGHQVVGVLLEDVDRLWLAGSTTSGKGPHANRRNYRLAQAHRA